MSGGPRPGPEEAGLSPGAASRLSLSRLGRVPGWFSGSAAAPPWGVFRVGG